MGQQGLSSAEKAPRTLDTWVSIVGLTYVVLVTLRVTITRALSQGTTALSSLIYLSILVFMLFLGILFILAGKRWAYRYVLTAAGIFLVFHLLAYVTSCGGASCSLLANLVHLVNPEFFVSVISLFPVLVLVIYHASHARRELMRPSPNSTETSTRRILLPTIAVIALVAGGVSIGLAVEATATPVVPPLHPDVTIVEGAFHPANLESYLPAKLTIKVGETIVWYNGDITSHTITSTTGIFDSKDIPVGATYSYTFTQAGVYEYYCVYHYLMTGVISVTNE